MNREYLQRLTTDGTERARLVEVLRASASVVDGTADGVSELDSARAAPRLAKQLRYAAAMLCDHARNSPDGLCRYCEAVLAG